MEVKCVVPGERGMEMSGEIINFERVYVYICTTQRSSQPQIGQLAELVDATVGRHHSIKTE